MATLGPFVLAHHAHIKSALCLVALTAGVAWILAFPYVCVTTGEPKPRGTYFSENALMGEFYHAQNVEARDWAAPIEPLTALGFASSSFSASVHILYPHTPGDKRDALAIIVTPNSPAAVAVAVARLTARAKWLSKNIVLVQPRDARELQRALATYSDEAGPIRQAVVLNVSASPAAANSPRLEVQSQGSNGNLPNLDLVNLAVAAAKKAMLAPVVISAWGAPRNRVPLFGSGLASARHATLMQFASQVAFGPSGWHAVPLARGIDAVTLAGAKKEAMVVALEVMLRSLSGLDEKLHHSYFFYLLMDTDTFVSVDEYVWPMLLVLAPLAVNVMHAALFFDHERQGLSRLVAAAAAYGAFAACGLAAFLAAPDKALFTWFTTAVVSSGVARATLAAADVALAPALRWQYVAAVVSLALFVVHAALAILDFALALASAAVVLPAVLLARPPPQRAREALPWLCALAWLSATSSPVLLRAVDAAVALHPDFYQGASPLHRLSFAAHEFGIVHLALYCMAVFPAQLAAWGICTGLFGCDDALVLEPHVRTAAAATAVHDAFPPPPVAPQPAATTQQALVHTLQVGGSHDNVKFTEAGCVAKSETDAEQFDAEVAFYQVVHSHHDALAAVIPRFIQVNASVKPRVMLLEDLVKLVSKNAQQMPVNIMDVKLGVRSFRQDAPNKAKPEYFAKYAEFTSKMSGAAIEAAWASVASAWWEPAIPMSSAATALSTDVAKLLEPASSADQAAKTALSRLPSLMGLNDEEAAALLPITSPAPKLPPSLAGQALGKRDYLLFRDATTTSATQGYRLTACTAGAFAVSQAESRLVASPEQFVDVMRKFTSDGDSAVVTSFLADLRAVREALEASVVFPKYDFVGTSLLFLYCPANGKTAVRWIDFANVTSPVSDDANGIRLGIERLQGVLESLCT